MRKKTVKDIKKLAKKRIFLTADFNISLSNGKIANETRILETMPTINFLLSKRCKIIIASHLDRPKGYDKKYSLKPVAKSLQRIIKRKVHLIDRFWEKEALTEIESVPNNEIILLENIRFCHEEKENNFEFARHLSSMADIFVNDAFGTSHRVHASTVGIAQFLPTVAGLLMDQETTMLSKVIDFPKKPFVVIIGGAKTPEKISVIEVLLNKADTILLGGAIANTFLAAWGFGMGKSLVDYEMVEMARYVFWKAAGKHSALVLPQDLVIYDKNLTKKSEIIDYNLVPNDVTIYDIGPKTLKYYGQIIKKAKTIIWNGPMGLYENKMFSHGTDNILKEVSSSNAFSIIGGGDTLNSLKNEKYLRKISHISTGGSAMLEFIKRGTLPGIEVIQNY